MPWPFRRERRVEQGPEPPGVDLLGVRLWLHSFQRRADSDADDDDTVVGEQHIVRIKDQVVDSLVRRGSQSVSHRADDKPGLVS
jgi:hypothetical protein